MTEVATGTLNAWSHFTTISEDDLDEWPAGHPLTFWRVSIRAAANGMSISSGGIPPYIPTFERWPSSYHANPFLGTTSRSGHPYRNRSLGL